MWFRERVTRGVDATVVDAWLCVFLFVWFRERLTRGADATAVAAGFCFVVRVVS